MISNCPLIRSRREVGLFSFREYEKKECVVGRTDWKTESQRAPTYSRFLDKNQAEVDKSSIFEQISDMEDYCKEKGMTILPRYQEVGRGWSKKRPEFQRMLADANIGRFDTIVC